MEEKDCIVGRSFRGRLVSARRCCLFVREKSGDVDDATLLMDVVLGIGVSTK